ncbi:MAG: M56 family metallopeptidase [Geodermatophilaceae bacterium]
MTVALALLGYALLLSTVGANALNRADWVDRAPRLGIAAWQALSASVILAIVLGGIALMIPTGSLGQSLAELLDACGAAIRAQYDNPGGNIGSTIGGLLALGIVGRATFCLAREVVVAARSRRRQLDTLALIGRQAPDLDALIVDHDSPAAYCLPGRDRQIVLTSAAVSALTADQLQAVLAHERAHLRGRHHLVLAGAQGMQRAFPFVLCFRHARRNVGRLVEMLADDQAGRRCPRLTIAAALVALAASSVPPAALSAGGPTALARVQRLAAPAQPLGLIRTTIGGLLVLAAFAVPFAVSAVPALAAASANYCPVEFPAS